MSDVEWFCGECAFTGEKDQVLDHHRQTGHVYAAGDYIFMVDLDTITIGVTGWAHEGIKPTWVHANFCHRYDCRTVLNDDEVQDHVRRHIANGTTARNGDGYAKGAPRPAPMIGTTAGPVPTTTTADSTASNSNRLSRPSG